MKKSAHEGAKAARTPCGGGEGGVDEEDAGRRK